MAKAPWCGDEIYDAAAAFRDRCLIDDGSLFSEGTTLWTGEALGTLSTLVDSDPGPGKFVDKLILQLDGRSDHQIQLTAEAVALLLTFVHDTSGDLRRKHVERILGEMREPAAVSAEIDAAFHAGGVASFSAGNAWRHAHVRLIIRFAARVKLMPRGDRAEALVDSSRVRELVHEVSTSTGAMAANALLHVLFPETFEYMVSEAHRDRFIETFAAAPGVMDGANKEERIGRIRALVQADQANPVNLYEQPLYGVWAHDPSPQWAEATILGGKVFERASFDADERTYKLEVASALAEARTAVVADDDDWAARLKKAVQHSRNNLTNWRATQPFVDWVMAEQSNAQAVLAEMWADDQRGVAERLETFLTGLPKQVVSGGGTRLSIGSLLLLGVDPRWIPFFKPTPADALRKALGLASSAPSPLEPESLTRPEEIATYLGVSGKRVRDFLRKEYPRDDERWGSDWHLTPDQIDAALQHFADATPIADEPATLLARYAAWVDVLQELRLRLVAAGHPIRDLLDAQGVAWWLIEAMPADWSDADKQALERFRRGEIHEDIEVTSESTTSPGDAPGVPPVSADMAAALFLPEPWLKSVTDLLTQTRQIILYGPPGTGKTFLAIRLGEHIASVGGTSRLVQFHPSYTYEDFFEGFRPEATDDGSLRFKLVPGALRDIARAARDQPDVPHLLIVDEINRGNIAKVFGELYFLLEYRNYEIRLQYSGQELFSLPSNLYIVGTMNTADKSIALVDAALRRRFAFIGLMPTKPPVDTVLASWLAKHNLDPEPAALLSALNEAIADADFSIGPSYFMTKDGTAPKLDRIWQFSIMPLLEEHFYGRNHDLEARFGLAALRSKITAAADAVAPPPEGPSADQAADDGGE